MPRPVDETKLIAIKKATMQVVVEEGISGASISQIAQRAEVSVGYLYRFYEGKRELLESLFQERFQGIYQLLRNQMEEYNTVEELVTAFTEKIYENVDKESGANGFFHKLISDFSFEIPKANQKAIVSICEEIVQMGKNTGEIRQSITTEQFFAIVVGGTLQFINIRLRNIFSKKRFAKETIKENIITTLQALK